MDAVILARLQFAFTISYHILWPTLTIGLGCFTALLSGGCEMWSRPAALRKCNSSARTTKYRSCLSSMLIRLSYQLSSIFNWTRTWRPSYSDLSKEWKPCQHFPSLV